MLRVKESRYFFGRIRFDVAAAAPTVDELTKLCQLFNFNYHFFFIKYRYCIFTRLNSTGTHGTGTGIFPNGSFTVSFKLNIVD